MLILAAAASLFIAAARLLFLCNAIVFRHNEKSLPYDFFWTCYIIMEMLYWNDYICLMRIDSYDELMSDVRNVTLTYVYTYDIASKSLDFHMTLGYWVICE